MMIEDQEAEVLIDEQDIRVFKNVVQDNGCALEFLSLPPKVFINSDSKKFAEFISDYIQTYRCSPSIRTIKEQAEKSPFKETFLQIAEDLNKVEVESKEFKYDLEKVKNKFILAEGKKLALAPTIKSPEDVFAYLESIKITSSAIERITTQEKSSYIQKTLKSHMHAFQERYMAKIKNPELFRGYLTGYHHLDYITNGFSLQDMIIIGGETGAGKSILLSNMAVQMWLGKNNYTSEYFTPTGRNILYFSLEMPYDLCLNRVFGKLGNIPMNSIRDARLTKDEFNVLNKCTSFIKKYPYEFEIVDVPRGLDVAAMEDRFKEACSRFKPDVVVVDYLGLLDDSSVSSEQDWLKLGVIAGKLHEFGRANNVVVLTAAQLNRHSKNTGTSPVGLHRFGRSSLIAHHSPLVLQIESRQDEHTYGDMIVHIVKNRNGSLGTFTLDKNLVCGAVSNQEITFTPDTANNFLPQDTTDISALLDKYSWGEKETAEVKVA